MCKTMCKTMRITKTCLFIILFFLLSISINAEILIIHEETAYPGGLIRVYVITNEKIENLSVLFTAEDEEKITRFEGFKYDPGLTRRLKNLNIECFVAIISTGSTLKYGKYKASVYINNEKSSRKDFPVNIEKKEFIRETISLNQNLSDLRNDNSKRRERETVEINKLFATFNKNNIFAETAVIKPVIAEPCYVTSWYGDIRKFIYNDGQIADSIHNGIDYAAAQGTIIFSCAAGKVVFADNRLITGNSVIIEHLPGLYSIYYHLDKIYVNENMFVSKGATIGVLGSTGLATGPHLHWEIRNQTITVDPDFLILNQIIDKNKIISIIKNDFIDIVTIVTD